MSSIVSGASLCRCTGMSVGSSVHCACRGVEGQECTAPLHCVGASLGMLWPLSLDHKSFQRDFSGINMKEERCCAM